MQTSKIRPINVRKKFHFWKGKKECGFYDQNIDPSDITSIFFWTQNYILINKDFLGHTASSLRESQRVLVQILHKEPKHLTRFLHIK